MILLFFVQFSFAQNVTITPNGITPNFSENYPRLHYEEILELPDPKEGDMAFDKTFECLRIYNGKQWLCSFQDANILTPTMVPVVTSDNDGGYYGGGMVTDEEGNLYISGIFGGTVDFGGTFKTSHPSEADMGGDLFLAKYDAEGVLQWVQTAGGVDGYLYFENMVKDASGNLYIAGSFGNTVSFGNQTITSTSESSLFIVKFSSSGSLIWVKTAGGNGNVYYLDLAVNSSGKIWISGSFYGTINFGSTSISANANDLFLARYSSSGNLEMVNLVSGSSNKVSDLKLAINSDDDILVSGSYTGTLNFGIQPISNIAGYDIFLAKFKVSTDQWIGAVSIGGEGNDRNSGLAIDADDNIYLTGTFSGTISFGSKSLQTIKTRDSFFAKYDSEGIFEKAEKVGRFDNLIESKGITLDPAGNIYIYGSFSERVNFYNRQLIASAYADLFLAKYDSNGNYIWVQSDKGFWNNSLRNIVIDENCIYATGFISIDDFNAEGYRDILFYRLDNP